MSSESLANLAKIGKLKAQPPTQAEFDGLLRSGRTRLKDAQNPASALESRFELVHGTPGRMIPGNEVRVANLRALC